MAATSTVSIQIKGQRSLSRALRVLADTDVPYLDEALSDSGRMLRSAASTRSTGGISSAVSFVGLRGSGASKRALVVAKHPGAKPMEFGRTNYYRGFTGRRQKATGQAFRSSGQRPRPFVGIKEGNAAIGATEEQIRARLQSAIEQEWARFDDSGGA